MSIKLNLIWKPITLLMIFIWTGGKYEKSGWNVLNSICTLIPPFGTPFDASAYFVSENAYAAAS